MMIDSWVVGSLLTHCSTLASDSSTDPQYLIPGKTILVCYSVFQCQSCGSSTHAERKPLALQSSPPPSPPPRHFFQMFSSYPYHPPPRDVSAHSVRDTRRRTRYVARIPDGKPRLQGWRRAIQTAARRSAAQNTSRRWQPMGRLPSSRRHRMSW